MTIREMLRRFFGKKQKLETDVSYSRFDVIFRIPGMQRIYKGFKSYSEAYNFAMREKASFLKMPLRDLLTADEFEGVTRQVGNVTACKELERAPGAQIYTNVFEIFNGTRVSLGMYDSVEDADRLADSDYGELMDRRVAWYVETYWGSKLVINIRRNNRW